MTAETDALVGAVLDHRYRVDRLIGVGGMGRVYLARQLRVGRDVAIKVLRPELMDQPRRVARFEREADITARLRDPHVVRLIDRGRAPDGRVYIVYEHLVGETLHDRLRRGPLPVMTTLRLLRDICSALTEAHGQGVVHRDLKPANIFVEILQHREVVKLLDFGVARLMFRAPTARRLIGTLGYMSPEQALDLPVDGRSDLFSLGLVAHACLTGRRRTQRTGSGSVRPIKPAPFAEAAPDAAIPVAVEALVFELVSPDPERRPRTAAIVAERIERLLPPAFTASRLRLRPASRAPCRAPTVTGTSMDELAGWPDSMTAAGVDPAEPTLPDGL